MTIDVTCLSCGKVLHIADHLAGRKGKCPACGTVMQIPVVAAQSPPGGTPGPLDDTQGTRFLPPTDAPPADLPPPRRQNTYAQMGTHRKITASDAESGTRSAWVGWAFGVALVLGGAAVAVYALFVMDVGVSSGYGERPLANMDLMNQRLGYTITGVGLFVAGTILCGLSSVRRALWQTLGV